MSFRVIVEVGDDDHTSYFEITKEQAEKILELPKDSRWDFFESVRTSVEIHSDHEVDLFWDASGYTDDEIEESDWKDTLET